MLCKINRMGNPESMITIYHNPRCSKSRQTLALIESSNRPYRVVEYLKTPLSVEQLRTLIQQLALPPHAIVRAQEAPYRELLLDKTSDEETLLQALAAHPILLQRPIVQWDAQAILCRPPENVLRIL